MLIQKLTLSYECLNAIGTSWKLEEMIFNVMTTFSRKTGAISSKYQIFDDDFPLVKIGKNIEASVDNVILENKNTFIYMHKDLNLKSIIIPLNNGYLQFIYKKRAIDLNTIVSIFDNFREKIDMAINSCNNIKDLKFLNEKLEYKVKSEIEKNRQSEKMIIAQSKQAVMGEMIEMIAHQWRQPITAVSMISNNLIYSLAIDNLDKNVFLKELNTINSQVIFLSETIDNFRSFFKPAIKKEKVSLQQIIQDAISLVDKQLENKNIKLYFKISENIKFYLFKNELIQVLLNVIANAKDALLENDVDEPFIKIDYEKVDDSICINIEDNAKGIKKSVMPKIFEPYFSTKLEKNGTGLGLYMSKIIVTEYMNGEIYALNTKVGAKFVIKIRIDK